jgi:hypothetical protein
MYVGVFNYSGVRIYLLVCTYSVCWSLQESHTQQVWSRHQVSVTNKDYNTRYSVDVVYSLLQGHT